MRLTLFLLLVPFLALAQPEGFENTGNKLFYRLHTPGAERKAAIGDFITVRMSFRTETDSVLFDSRKRGGTVQIQVKEMDYKGDINEGFLLMGAGDSATFATSANMYFGKVVKQNRPRWIRSGSYIFFEVKIEKLQSPEEFREEKRKESEALRASEAERLKSYLSSKNWEEPALPSGLYYQETEKSAGKVTKNGSVVRVHYEGRLLDGRVFDTSHTRGDPITFTLGSGQVIQAWEEAVLKMRAGTKATIVVPSALGYGASGAPGSIIGPFAPLVFDLELVSVD